MAVPNKKMYDRKGKLVFDPNNPEDVRRQEELNKQIEMAKQLFSIVDPRGGGGIGAMARGISKAALAKMSKSKFTQNKAKQILELVTKPMTRGKKSVPKNTTKAAPTVKEVVETKPTIPTTVPTTMELAQIPGSSVKTIKEGIKSFKGTKGTFTPRDTERVAKAREILNQPIAGNMRPSTISQGFKSPFANTSLRKYVPEANPYKDFNKFKLDGDVVNKPLSNLIEGTMIAGGLGMGSALISSGNRLSNKDKKQTTTPQKTGPVDLKRITNTKPSSIPGVSIVKGTDGKDYGIVWDNKTQSWDYYRDDKTKKTPENKQQQEKVRGGGYIPIDNTDKNKGNNQGGGTNTGGGGTGGGTTTKSKTRIEFEKAFAEARKQAGGAGGIFEFNNKKYGTALEGETVPKNRVEVGKTTTPVTIKNDYPTAESDPTLEIAMQQDSIRQQMATKPLPTKPLSELVFKTTAKAAESQKIRNSMDEQNALRSIIADNRTPLKKKRYGGNLAMLKYMK